MDNFNLKEYLAENKLLKEYLDLEIDEDQVTINAFSGEYFGFIEDDGTVDFSVTGYEEEREDGEIDFDEDNWKDILGPKHAFVKISNQIPTTKVEAAGDYVMITVDVEDLKGISDLAENKLTEVNEQENYTQKKYTEEEWKRELDLNVEMAKRLIAHQAMGNADAVWEDLVADLMALQKQSIIPGNIKFFKEWIESQETNGLPNRSSGSFFTGLTDIDGLLSAMNFEEYDEETDEELYTDEEYDEAQRYHTDKINQLDWTKY